MFTTGNKTLYNGEVLTAEGNILVKTVDQQCK